MNERDWTLLNAYADGELDPAESERLSARLRREPALAAELRRVRSLKARLAGLQKAPAGLSQGGPVPSVRATSVAVAASLLIAGLVGLAAIRMPTGVEPASANLVLALHSELSEAPHADTAAIHHDVRMGEIAPPDLSGSNLRLVEVRRVADSASEAVGYHYRGPRGCRVTLVVAASLELPDGAALAESWTIGDRALVLVADGMDPMRFAAIAEYAEAATREGRPGDRLRIALEERTASARPCA